MKRNERYPWLPCTNTWTTIGDEEQFDGSPKARDTFRYMFHKFKKGIYVCIVDGELKTFSPFNKTAYVRESDPYDFSSKLLDAISEEGGYAKPNIPHQIFWWENNGLVRYDVFKRPRVNQAYVLYETVLSKLAHRCPPGLIEFFINVRDFPLLKKDRTEPYTNVWGDGHPLISHNYRDMLPILSMTSNPTYDDITIPNWCDLSSFTPDLQNVTDNRIIFRGSSSGIGVTIDTNCRLKAAHMSMTELSDILDAGITKWNLRPRVIRGVSGNFLCTISKNIRKKCRKVDFMSYREQSSYKYILDLPGHVEGFRFSHIFQLKRVVFRVRSDYETYSAHVIQPWVHYIPIKADLSDLREKYKWIENNPSIYQKIVDNVNTLDMTTDMFEERLLERIVGLPSRAPDPPIVVLPLNVVKPENAIYTSKNTIIAIKDGYIEKIPITERARLEYDHEQKISRYLKEQNASHCRLEGVYVNGKSFLCRLKDSSFRVPEIIRVLKRIVHVYTLLYKQTGFIHNDATPWNIVLTPDQQPIIIDYGKSRVATIPSGSNTLVETDTRDLFGISINTLLTIIKHRHLDNRETKTVMRWFNKMFGKSMHVNDMKMFLVGIRRFDALQNIQDKRMCLLKTPNDYFAMYNRL